ncbi:DUF6600 domain-containing protein [Anaeromyxobacter paludicola]|uniref:Uncharacterized protein n=1 Tax=Anaeromyxobacter paludicola TaxID=2918171 RepID=A0ABN6N3P7_9BACT|nr:DUF6600 domain-containing protein [Anaeromyxobacter paludicola]BDG07805.1 hypothetical protein AMPC_09180 [Anaeromyxobacter paludicola]
MFRHLAVVAALAALAVPRWARAQSDEYPYPQGEEYGDYQGEVEYPQAPPPPSDPQVDVHVDMSTPGASIGFETFHDGLAPYGEWVSVGAYGRVWRPLRVAAGWRPYYYGRWEWTNEGWFWQSEEPWGWAAYHYGRWAYDGYYGWVWVPGYQWAPAWVTWRFGADAIGWAPLSPGFSVYVTNYPAYYSYWTFVPCGRFAGYPVYSAAYAPSYVPRWFHATRPAPPRSAQFGAPAPAWGGPGHRFVEQRVGHAIAPARLVGVASPGHMAGVARPGVVPVYRPEARAAPVRPGAPGSSFAPQRPGSAAPVAPARPAPAQPWTGRPSQPPGQVAPNRASPSAAQPVPAPGRPQGTIAPRGDGNRPAAIAPPRAVPAPQGVAPRGPSAGASRAPGGGPGFAAPRAPGGPAASAPRGGGSGGSGHANGGGAHAAPPRHD